MSAKSKLIGLWAQINNEGTPRRRYGRKRLKRMATAHVHRQIDKARKEGRFTLPASEPAPGAEVTFTSPDDPAPVE